MKNYLVFGYDLQYPGGGLSDIKMSFNDLETAKSHIIDLLSPFRSDIYWNDIYDILALDTGKCWRCEAHWHKDHGTTPEFKEIFPLEAEGDISIGGRAMKANVILKNCIVEAAQAIAGAWDCEIDISDGRKIKICETFSARDYLVATAILAAELYKENWRHLVK